MLGSVFLYLVLVPIIFYALSWKMTPDIRLGIFLICASSTAMVCALISGFLKLKTLWATVFVIFTSFFVPFTLPFLVKILFHLETALSFREMMFFLSKIIFIPSILAFIFRKYLPKTSKIIQQISGFFGVICMTIFVIILVSKNQSALAENLFSFFSLKAVVYLFLVFLMLFIIGYFLPADNLSQRLTNSLVFGTMNNGLVILLSAEFFSADVFLVVLLSEIPIIFFQFAFAHFVHYKFRK